MKKRGGKKKEAEPPEEEGISGRSSGDELVASSGNGSQGEESVGGKSNSRKQKKNSAAAAPSPSSGAEDKGSKAADETLDAGSGREPNPVSSPKSVKFNLGGGGDEIAVDTSSHQRGLDNTEYFSDLGIGSGEDELAPTSSGDRVVSPDKAVQSSLSETGLPPVSERPANPPNPIQTGGLTKDQHSSRASNTPPPEQGLPLSAALQITHPPAPWVRVSNTETQREMYFNMQTGFGFGLGFRFGFRV